MGSESTPVEKPAESGTVDNPLQDEGMEVVAEECLGEYVQEKPKEETTKEGVTEEETTEEEESEEDETTEEDEESEEEEETPEEETTEEEDLSAESSKKKGGVEKRIGQLVRKAKEAEEKLVIAEKYYAEQLKQAQSIQQTTNAVNKESIDMGTKPKIDDFKESETPEADFLEALTDWKVDKKLAERSKSLDAVRIEQETAVYKAKLLETFESKRVKAREKYEDFDKVAGNPVVPYNETMQDVVMSSEIGPELAYFFGNNITKAMEIQMMEPLEAARALGALEAKIASNSIKKKKVTTAKKPVNPIKGGTASTHKKAEDMTDEEYFKERESGKSIKELL